MSSKTQYKAYIQTLKKIIDTQKIENSKLKETIINLEWTNNTLSNETQSLYKNRRKW